MINSNLAGSSPSPCDAAQLSLRTEQESLFGDSFPFELRKEFRDVFDAHGNGPLPSAYNLLYWEEHVGRPAWAIEAAEVEAANRRALAEHANELEVVNAAIDEVMANNERRLSDHAAATRNVGELNARLKTQYAADRRMAKDYVKRTCKLKLKAAIDRQSQIIDEAIEACRREVEQESKSSFEYKSKFWLFLIGLLTGPTMLGPAICGMVMLFLRRAHDGYVISRLCHKLTDYNDPAAADRSRGRRYSFWLYRDEGRKAVELNVHTPVLFPDIAVNNSRARANCREQHPLGIHLDWLLHPEGQSLLPFFELVISAFPLIGIVYNLMSTPAHDGLKEFIELKVRPTEVKRLRREALLEALTQELALPGLLKQLTQKRLDDLGCRLPALPSAPPKPRLRFPPSLPAPPVLRRPVQIDPPDWCFDADERQDFSHVLKGALIHSAKNVAQLTRARIFADNCIRPSILFGGVPIPFPDEPPHMLILGTSGSGKTTTILRLLSSLLPLTRGQAERIFARFSKSGERWPLSSDEWTRSRTFQAVIYNAKEEYLNYLKALGFDQDVDLFNFDSTDPNGYAWDLAADIDDADSIRAFAEQLLPQNASAKRDEALEKWQSKARGAIEAVIISLRNAATDAGRKPDWNLRDLVEAFGSEDKLKFVLGWHDTPEDRKARYFELSGPQKSSIFLTVHEALDNLLHVANRWYHLQQRGRIVSLKHWARELGHTVLLLPNTPSNKLTNGPLNAALLKALTGIVLQNEYSKSRDASGQLHTHQRHFVFDEIGHAGRLPELERLMGEGRSFGVNVILGLHQLSQLLEVYGDHVSKTVLGMCKWHAFLLAGDSDTAEWISKFVGNCLRIYDKTSYSYGNTNGKSFTVTEQISVSHSRGESHSKARGSNWGSSESHSSTSFRSSSQQSSRSSGGGGRSTTTSGSGNAEGDGESVTRGLTQSENEGTTDGTSSQDNTSHATGYSHATHESKSNTKSQSTELRGEAAIEPHEFGRFAVPRESGYCEGVYFCQSLPTWRVQLRKEEMQPIYEHPERLNDWPARYSRKESARVNKSFSWTEEDLIRLCLNFSPPEQACFADDAIMHALSSTDTGRKLLEGASDAGKSRRDKVPEAKFLF